MAESKATPAAASFSAPTDNKSLIRMSGIKKVFYTDEVETHALQDIHIEIAPGEYVAIEGPSGCGKTTLLSILGLLDTPSDGEYILANESVANLTASERIDLHSSASVFGDISAPRLVMDDGAVVKGKVQAGKKKSEG